MGYISDSLGLGEFGCGAGCSCQGCRSSTTNLSQVYEQEEPPPPPKPNLSGWFGRYSLGRGYPRFAGRPWGRSRFGFGQPPARRGWRERLDPQPAPARLRFLNLDQFNWNQASLTPRHLPLVRQLAEHVRLSQGTRQPIGFVRLVGHTDDTGPEKYNVPLGNQRAQSVKSALETLLQNDIASGRIPLAILVEPSPGESMPLTTNRTPGGRALNRRVEVFIAPPAPPTPPLTNDRPTRPTHIPSPQEAAGQIFHEETPSERITRLLKSPAISRLPQRSFSQMFWQHVDDSLNSAMNRVGVPEKLRDKIREGAHAAISRGAEAIFDQVLDAAKVTGSARNALKSSVQAAFQTPVR